MIRYRKRKQTAKRAAKRKTKSSCFSLRLCGISCSRRQREDHRRSRHTIRELIRELEPEWLYRATRLTLAKPDSLSKLELASETFTTRYDVLSHHGCKHTHVSSLNCGTCVNQLNSKSNAQVSHVICKAANNMAHSTWYTSCKD